MQALRTHRKHVTERRAKMVARCGSTMGEENEATIAIHKERLSTLNKRLEQIDASLVPPASRSPRLNSFKFLQQ